MDRDPDDDEPALRTREAAKRAQKVTRTLNAVDAMVGLPPTSAVPT